MSSAISSSLRNSRAVAMTLAAFATAQRTFELSRGRQVESVAIAD
jgi:hypothetical protein